MRRDDLLVLGVGLPLVVRDEAEDAIVLWEVSGRRRKGEQIEQMLARLKDSSIIARDITFIMKYKKKKNHVNAIL